MIYHKYAFGFYMQRTCKFAVELCMFVDMFFTAVDKSIFEGLQNDLPTPLFFGGGLLGFPDFLLWAEAFPAQFWRAEAPDDTCFNVACLGDCAKQRGAGMCWNADQMPVEVLSKRQNTSIVFIKPTKNVLQKTEDKLPTNSNDV